MQGSEKPKSAPEQVIVVVESENSKPEQSQEKSHSVDPNMPEAKPTNPKIIHTVRTLQRLNYLKPKSRFMELNCPTPLKSIPESPNPIATTNASSEADSDGEEPRAEEEEHPTEQNQIKKRKINRRSIVEWTAFVAITACLISSLTDQTLVEKTIWGVHVWKWCLMALAILSGHLVSGWLTRFTVFFIERVFVLREKVLYFTYGLRRSVQACVWLGLVLLAWMLIFDPEVSAATSPRHHKLLNKISRALIAIWVGSIMWLVKIVLVKMLASCFHVATFFDRMKASVFHQYILDALSGKPGDEISRTGSHRKTVKRSRSLPARLSRPKEVSTSNRVEEELDMEKLKKLCEGNASSWNMKRLVNHVMSTGLSTISTDVDETEEEEIASELDARSTADWIFKNVAKEHTKYIEEDDLLRFLTKEEVHAIFPLFEGAADTGQIKKSAFRNWVVRAYRERKALAHALNDTKTAVRQLHRLASAVVIVIIILVSLLVMGVATTKVIFVVTSQILIVGFIFNNTCKTIFESIIFVFVMHPFDVGDRCVIDGVQMIVEEMNILSTVFLRYDNEKIYYPNTVLLTKAISNFNRSPEMGDTVEFSIDVSTSAKTFNEMKEAIRTYIEGKPKHWQGKHWVVVKEIENVNKMKVVLYVLHTINFQNFQEKNVRRSDLVFELKNIFERLDIKYYLLPQDVKFTHPLMIMDRGDKKI